jgi:predicted lipase
LAAALLRAADLKAAPVPIFVTGHSLGAAYATLAFGEMMRTPEPFGNIKLVDLYTFGSPRVGIMPADPTQSYLKAFEDALKALPSSHCWRVVQGTGDIQDFARLSSM